jgi:hypothetical protein
MLVPPAHKDLKVPQVHQVLDVLVPQEQLVQLGHEVSLE